MKHLKSFNENIKIKRTDIEGLLVDIVDNGFSYSIQESEIGININRIIDKNGYAILDYSCYNITSVYETFKTLEGFVTAYDSSIEYFVNFLNVEDPYNYNRLNNFECNSVDGISGDYDIVYIKIKIRY